jgi:hypothetical protein
MIMPEPSSNRVVIGSAGDHEVAFDLDVLMVSRLLIQAGSGAGKSWLIRRLAEQSFPLVPQIIIDPEGDFATLRERYDFVLVGEGGDTPATVRSAPALAHKLLELGASAVCDLYELGDDERHAWAAAFLKATMDAPKTLWRPVQYYVDEAHIFCPEKGYGESPAAQHVAALATRGRKRGFGAVFATQRLGVLRKDTAGVLENVLIGKTTLDIDVERALKALGIGRKAKPEYTAKLQKLRPGAFFAFGRAISEDAPTLLTVGGVHTTHPKPGLRVASPPPAPARIRHLLRKLTNLSEEPAKAEALSGRPASNTGHLTSVIARLERELAAVRNAPPAPPIEVPVVLEPQLERVVNSFARIREELGAMLAAVQGEVAKLSRPSTAVPAAAPPKKPKTPVSDLRLTVIAPPNPAASVGRTALPAVGALARGARQMLSVLASRGRMPLEELAILSVQPFRGNTFRIYAGALRAQSLAALEDDHIAITDEGRALASTLPRSPLVLEEVIAAWKKRKELTGKAKGILDLLVHERSCDWGTVADKLALDPDGNTMRIYVGMLLTNGLAVRSGTGMARRLTIHPALVGTRGGARSPVPVPAVAGVAARVAESPPQRRPRSTDDDGAGIEPGARAILEALVTRGPLSQVDLGVVCRIQPKGSSLRSHVGALISKELVERGDGKVFDATPAGRAFLGSSLPAVAAPSQLVSAWKQHPKIQGRAKDMIEMVAAEHEVPLDVLAARLKIDRNGSSMRGYVGKLISFGLARRTNGRRSLRVHPALEL